MEDSNNSKQNNYDILLENLNNSDWSVRAKAVYQLKDYDDPIVIDALINTLKNDDLPTLGLPTILIFIGASSSIVRSSTGKICVKIVSTSCTIPLLCNVEIG